MPDEAIIRIIIEGGGASVTKRSTPPPSINDDLTKQSSYNSAPTTSNQGEALEQSNRIVVSLQGLSEEITKTINSFIGITSGTHKFQVDTKSLQNNEQSLLKNLVEETKKESSLSDDILRENLLLEKLIASCDRTTASVDSLRSVVEGIDKLLREIVKIDNDTNKKPIPPSLGKPYLPMRHQPIEAETVKNPKINEFKQPFGHSTTKNTNEWKQPFGHIPKTPSSTLTEARVVSDNLDTSKETKTIHPGSPKGTDTVPAWLTPGEFVVNSQAAAENYKQLEEINNSRAADDTTKMAEGGRVEYLSFGGAAATAGRAGAALSTFGGSTAAVGAALSAGAKAFGPVGVVMDMAMAVVNVFSGAMKGAIGVVGDFAKAMADPSADISIPISNVGQSLSEFGNKLIYVFPPLGLLTIAAGESAAALGGLIQAIDATADRYSEFSPEITQAQAIAEIRQTMGDFRRAQEISGEMVKYLMQQSDIQQKFEDIKVKVLIKMLPVVTRMLEILEKMLPSAEGFVLGFDLVTGPLQMLVTLVHKLLGIEEEKQIGDIEDPTMQLFSNAFATSLAGGQVPRV